MSEVDNALNEITKVYNIFRGAEKIKEALENVKGFETVEKEVSARIAKLKAEESQLQKRKDELLNEAIKKRDQSAEVLLNAQAQAIQIEKDASAKAKGIVETAQEKKAKLDLMVESAAEKLSVLTTDAANKAAELATLESKIKTTKASLLKLAEG